MISPLHASELKTDLLFKQVEKEAQRVPTFRELLYAGRIPASSFAQGTFTIPADYVSHRLVLLQSLKESSTLFLPIARSRLENPALWLSDQMPLEDLLNPTSTAFVPFVERLILAPGSLFMGKGDLHGDFHSLLAFIKHMQETGFMDKEDPLAIKNPAFHQIFLGDYVDRGVWGVEVLYVLMLLKIKNPQRVFSSWKP